jgi:hypothetical protein
MAHIIPDSSDYHMEPRVVPEGWSGRLRVRGEYLHTEFQQGVRYAYTLQSFYVLATGDRRRKPVCGVREPEPDGTLEIPFSPDTYGEWMLTIGYEDEHRTRNVPCNLGVYVLPERWWKYRPYIGELHAHSTGSDGTQEPLCVALRGRRAGFDFFALTDHRNFTTSTEMLRRGRELLGDGMLLLTGEEMHPEKDEETGTPVYDHQYHYVSVGHTQSVRDAYLEDEARSGAEVAAIVEEVRRRGPVNDLDLAAYAEGLWKLRKAKELGGLTLYCHPYWAWPLNLDRPSIDEMFANFETDAVEAFSRADPSSLMTNRLLQRGRTEGTLPVVGVSDVHDWHESTDLEYCTFVMAEERSRQSLLNGIREGRSVACRKQDTWQFLGELELTDFAAFYFARLHRLRTRVTQLQADLALASLRGSASSPELILRLNEELGKLDACLWA